jgi:hypothetical protein
MKKIFILAAFAFLVLSQQVPLFAETNDFIVSFSDLLSKMGKLRSHETEARLHKEFKNFSGKTLAESGWKIIDVKSSRMDEHLYCAFLVKNRTSLIVEKIPENVALDMEAGKSIEVKGTVVKYIYGDDMSFSIFQKYGFSLNSSTLLVFYVK